MFNMTTGTFIEKLKQIVRDAKGAFTAGHNSVVVKDNDEHYLDLRVDVEHPKGKLEIDFFEEEEIDDLDEPVISVRARIFANVPNPVLGGTSKREIVVDSVQHAFLVCNYILAGNGMIVREINGKRYVECVRAHIVVLRLELEEQSTDFTAALCDFMQISEPDFDNWMTWEILAEKKFAEYANRVHWFSGESDSFGPLSRYAQTYLLRVGEFAGNNSSPFFPTKFWYY